MAYGQVMACLLKLTLRNMFIVLGKSCGKNSCSYLLFCIEGTFVFTSYTLSILVRFQNLGFGIWNSALNNSWIPVTITEFLNPSFTSRQVIHVIQNPRLSWTNLHELSLSCKVETLFCPHAGTYKARHTARLNSLENRFCWLKNQRFSQRKLMLTSRTKILNKISGKQKGKACQNKLNSFSTVGKRQEIDENSVEEVQWLKRYQSSKIY